MRKTKLLITIVVILFFLASFFALSYYQIYQPIKLKKPVNFEIQKGQRIDEISFNLKKSGLIRSTTLFKIYLIFKNQAKNIQFGTYVFEENINIPQLVEIISQGKNQENKITVPEGMRILEIALYLQEKGVVTANDFILETQKQKYKSKYWFLGSLPETADLEGYLFPDTYFLEAKAKADQIVEKMLDNFDKKITQDLKKEIKKQNKNLKDIIILASIIEKEVPQRAERATVAGIYYNRMELGMKLEADPTVQYAKETERPSQNFKDFWTKITAEDYTAIISPHNTYLNQGLPPGPISNPSLDSIKAAVFPEKTDFLYFFNSSDGKIFYSQTAQEHETKKNQYLR